MTIGSATGEFYENELAHSMGTQTPKEENNSPAGSSRAPGGTLEESGEGVQINTDYSVKSGAVASKDDPGVVYIDPKIPSEFHPFLAVHEETERSLMAKPYSMPYDKAHIQATLAEKHAVEQAGMTWEKYTDAVDPHIATAEKGSGKNPPPDPHVNIEDAIGHHADKASTLEKADIKIGANWKGEGSDMEGPHKPLDEDQVHVKDLKDLPPDWKEILSDPTGREEGYRVRTPKPAVMSDVDERPVAGQKYAADTSPWKRANPAAEAVGGVGRAGSGGSVPATRSSNLVLSKGVSKPDNSFSHTIRDAEGEPTGYVNISPTYEGKALHVDMVKSFQQGPGRGPQIFKTANSFGPKEVMQLRKQLSEQYPKAEVIYGMRISGGRAAAGSTSDYAYVPLKKGVDVKAFKELHEKRFDWTAEGIEALENTLRRLGE